MRFHPKHLINTGLLLLVMAVPAMAEESFESLLNKASSGDVAAMYSTGVKLLQTEAKTTGSDTALDYLENVAKSGQPEYRSRAQLWLGRAYRDALGGTGKNAERAFAYFEQAAGKEGKYPEAQYELGKAYMNGTGTDRNLIAAYMWTALSVQEASPIKEKAEQQKQRLAEMLNEVQLEKAKLLVTQLATLYLN